MSDIDLTVEQIDRDGLEPTFTSIDNVDTYFAPRKGGRLILFFKNTGGSIAVVTFDVTKTEDGVAYTDPTVSVPATTGEVHVSGLGNVYEVETGSNRGKIKFTQDQATGVTVAAMEV
jgi:hypothetical protein